MNQLLNALGLIAFLSFSGCAPIDRAVYDTAKRQPTKNIEIFKDGRAPQRPFKVIGEITMPGHRDNELLRQGQIVEKAKAMGGDGLVFTVQPAGVNALGVSEWLFKGKVIVYDSDRSEKQEIGNDQMLTSKLLGRWESVAIKLKGPGAERMTMTFLSDSRFTCTSVEKGKTYPGSGYYFVKNGKLILTDNPDGQAKPEDAVDMIISGNFLMTTSEALGMAITYQKIQ